MTIPNMIFSMTKNLFNKAQNKGGIRPGEQ
ncbi:Uncharacterised protein [Serratia proteamaculans]|nr:Uncharacterised protein [Serratia proteamaculans]